MKNMNIHVYGSIVPNSGDIRRIKNIDNEIAEFYGIPSVEVTFVGIGDIPRIKENGMFKVGGKKNKKLYIFQPPKVRYYFPFYQSLIIAILGLIYRPKVIIGEMNFPYKFRRIFHFLNPNTRIISDIHGAVVEEYLYLNTNVNKKKLKYYEKLEKRTIVDADIIICQSDEMRNYICEKYNQPKNKVIVYRCGYDTSSFKVDANLRKEGRKELKIKEDEILFVYSGGLHGWQKVENSLVLFSEYCLHNPRSKMLVLTGDKELLNNLLMKDLFKYIRGKVLSISVPFTSVSKYLNAADIAFLLRDDHKMNAVASPTKLAEYLACGLPIITSRVALHWISEEGLRYLIFSEDINLIDKIDYALTYNRKEEEEEFAKKNLSLEMDKKNIKEFLELLNNY